MEIVYKKIDEIKPYENNPRRNENAVDYVANSIKEFGFKVPIVVDENNVIITGHTRYKASKKLGLKEVPTIIANDLTEEQVKAFRLADNKVSEQSTWNYKKLQEELKIIDTDMMESFGFDYIDYAHDEPSKDTVEDKTEEEKYYKCPNCEKTIIEGDLIICK